MKKIVLILLLFFSTHCNRAQEAKFYYSIQESSFPYPFSNIVNSVVTCTHDSQHDAHIGIVMPHTYSKQFTTMLNSVKNNCMPAIVFFTQTMDRTTVAFIHAMYPQLDFIVLTTFAENEAIAAINDTLTKGSFSLIKFFNVINKKTQFELLKSFFYRKSKRVSQGSLEIISLTLPQSYVTNWKFWESIFEICAKPHFTNDEIYVLPILFWIVPIKPELLYVIVLLLFLINLIILRNAVHIGKTSRITIIMFCIIFCVLWFSLVLTCYLLLLLLLKQLLLRSSSQKLLVLYPLLFWGLVYIHDNTFYKLYTTSPVQAIVTGIVFISSFILAVVPSTVSKVKKQSGIQK